MRVDSFLTLMAAMSAFLFLPSLSAQEEGGSGDAPAESKEAEPLNDIKLVALAAALPDLKGDDKFFLRESWWNGSIVPGKAKLIQVQLFRRNAYQFWFAVPSRDAKLNLNLYDSEGAQVSTEPVAFNDSNVIGMVVEPDQTGVYYVRISLQTNIDKEQDWAVIYAYR